jgi:DNA segregation ATPase FtsK/SpoIIIE-like protein
MVASKFDSRIIIAQVGAEKLPGRGDMLIAVEVNYYRPRLGFHFVFSQVVTLSPATE